MLSYLFYGRNGTGKTTLLSTFPKPILLIDVSDRGTASAKSPEWKSGDIMVYTCETFEDVQEAIEYCYDNSDYFKTVGMDTATQAQGFCVNGVKAGKSMTQQKWGEVSTLMTEMISSFLGLGDEGVIPVFLAQDRKDDGAGDGEDQLMPEVGPMMMPSLQRTIQAACRVVGQTYSDEKVDQTPEGRIKREVEFRLRIGPNPFYMTKVTKPKSIKVPQYIPDPNYNKLQAALNGTYDEKYGPKKNKPTTTKRKRR